MSEQERTEIYMKIPAVLMIHALRNDPTIRYPITITYRGKPAVAWDCHNRDDLERIADYFQKSAGVFAFGGLNRNIFVYKISIHHNQIYLDLADHARLVCKKSVFSTIMEDSVMVTDDLMPGIYQVLKNINFDHTVLNGVIIPQKK